METGGPDSSGDERPSGRGLDLAVWAAVIAVLVGLAAAIAWYLSNSTFTLREITFEDDSADLEILIPVAPAPEPPAEPAAASLPNAEGVTPPVWTRTPAPLYPEKALRRGIEQGEVTLRCAALASGRLDACEVVSESPPGAGFAEAALASTRQARVEPRRIDGVGTDSRITYTVRFRTAPEP